METPRTPQYIPLEKFSILISEDGRSIYESHFILEYIEAKYHEKLHLLPRGHQQVDARLCAAF